MIGTLLSILAFASSLAVAWKRSEHRPIACALGAAVGCALIGESGAPSRVHLAARVILHALTVYAYLALWAPSCRLLALPWLPVMLAPASLWTVALRAPNIAALAVGVVAWGLSDRVSMTITSAVVLTLLFNDAAGAILLAHPNGQAWPGRVGAIVVTLLHVGWMLRTFARRTRQPV